MHHQLAAAALLALLVGQVPTDVSAKVGGNHAPDGTEIHCDLPDHQHLRNKGGSDGAGLCVFTSVEHSARWQNVPALLDLVVAAVGLLATGVAQAVESIQMAVYLSGVKDGVVGSAILGLVGFLLLRRKA